VTPSAARPALLATAAGLAAGWLAIMALVWLYGEAPREIAAQLVLGTWAMPYAVGQVLYKATALLLTGIAVDVALRAGLFNIGGEGQLAVAGLTVAALGANLPAGTPAWIAVPVAAAAAPVAGAAWAVVPAVLRVRYRGHEVISTIMMNRIADATVGLVLARGLAIPGTVRTPDVAAGARLPRLDELGIAVFHGSAVSAAFPLAVVASAYVAVWLRRSRVGRETALVGLSPRACAAERIPVGRRQATALLLSGALAGLAAVGPVLGSKGYFESGLGAGAGFGGIAVALLGRGHPVGLVLAALLFGTLEQGGLAINARVPMEVATVAQGVVIAAIALADARVRAAVRGVAP
jgi:simple sugar transport system permease protein